MATHPNLLETALDALRNHGAEIFVTEKEPREGDTRADAFVQIGNGTVATTYVAEVKQFVTDTTVGAIVEQLRYLGKPPLLVTDYIAPRIADRLRENRIAFVDIAGNAYVKQPGMLIWTKGHRPEKGVRDQLLLDLKRQAATRAFEPGGLKVLFALLCNPELANRPYREIAERAGVAHGTVGWVMAELPHRRFLYDFGKEGGGRKLKQVEQLLAEWAAAYARKLKPKLLLGRFQAKDPNWWKALDPAIYGMVLGAEAAAARVTEYLRPAVITLYGVRAEPRLIIDHGLRADPKGDVEIAERFWRFETEETKKGLAPLPLIYADLLATGDPRCIETAGLIRDKYLDRLKQ